MNRREFIKAGTAATIGMAGLAGCTGQCEDDDCEMEGEEAEGEFDNLADDPAASNADVDLNKGTESEPWTEEEVKNFLKHHKNAEIDLGPEPNLAFEDDMEGQA